MSGPNAAGVAASSRELRAAFTQLEDELDVSIETFPEQGNNGPTVLITPMNDFRQDQEGFSVGSVNLEDLILAAPITDTPNTIAGFGE